MPTAASPWGVLVFKPKQASKSRIGPDAAAQLEKLFDDGWQFALRDDPLFLPPLDRQVLPG
ncbi:MAG: hypothetical protein HYS13_17780 [Planctomycetia bacterium]|nr:hypothetical protein [Planctomycetia bacterium]